MVERGHVVAQHVVDDLVDHAGGRGDVGRRRVLHQFGRVVDVHRLGLAVDDVRVVGLEHALPVRDGLPERHLVVLHEVTQLRLGLGWVQLELVSVGVVDAVPVHTRREFAEGEVDPAVGIRRTRCSLLGQLGPVLGQQLLGLVRGLALEVVDELGAFHRVVVGPRIATIQVEINESAFLLHVGDRGLARIGHVLDCAVELVLHGLHLGQACGHAKLRDLRVGAVTQGFLKDQVVGQRKTLERSLLERNPGGGGLAARAFLGKWVGDALAEVRRCDVQQLVVLARGDVQWPAQRVAGLGELELAAQGGATQVQVLEPVLQLLGAYGLVQMHEDVAAEAGLVLDAHGRRPLEDVVGLCATDIRQEVVHGLVALDAVEVQADPFGQLFAVGRALAGLGDQLTAQLALDHAVALLGVLLDVVVQVVERVAGLSV